MFSKENIKSLGGSFDATEVQQIKFQLAVLKSRNIYTTGVSTNAKSAEALSKK